MATSQTINNLVINNVESQEVYDYMVANGLIHDDELYLVNGINSAVLYTAQTLTDEQKAQVRENIGALASEDVTFDIVTIDSNGLMLASDKKKLDTIEEGAQKNTVIGIKGDNESTYRTGNVNITKANIGLSNVDNTADSDKPVSTAQATAIADAKKSGTDAQNSLNTHTSDSNNPHNVTAEQVGLGNVTNESKATMFTNAALTGTPTAPTATKGTNNTQIATTKFVSDALAELTVGTKVSSAEKADTATVASGLDATGVEQVKSIKVNNAAAADTATTATSANKTVGTLTVDINGSSTTFDGSGNRSITINAASLGLSGAMKFLGTTTTAISDGAATSSVSIGGTSTAVSAGNVVLYNGKEFVWNGSAWEELGDEGSHALKSITITAGSGLTGGGTLAENMTISHGDTSNVTDVTASGRKYVTGLTFDSYGHVTGTTTGTETVTDTNTTYDLAASTNSTNGNVKLNLTAGGSGSGTDSVSIKGTGATTVVTDANGIVTINSTNNNTTYSAGTGLTLTGTTFSANAASTSAAGIVQLDSTTNSPSTTTAATASAVKAAYDLAASKTSNTGTITGVTGGNGLTGSGTSGAVTLAVGAGNGISVAADAVSVKAGTGITVDANGVSNAGVRSITQDSTDGHKLSINTNGTSATITIPDNNTTYSAGTGLTLSGTTFNANSASTSAAGIVQLSSATNSTSTTLAATASAVKSAYDLANGKEAKHSAVTATLATASWSSLSQTVSVTGVTASNTVIVSPAPASHDAYCKAGVYCSAQASGKLTFKCTTTPTAALTVNVIVMGG